jgi:hypothetical protein
MKLEITLQGFKKWLSAHDNDNPVGFAAVSRECPLSVYLEQQNRLEYIYVNQDVYTTGERCYPLPVWAQRFVEGIDALSSPPVDVPRAVTAREAREILEQIDNKKGSK